MLMDEHITPEEFCLFDLVHHAGLFQTFVTPVDDSATTVLSFHDWLEKDHWGNVRLYQYPSLPWDHLLLSEVPIDINHLPAGQHSQITEKYAAIDRVSAGERHKIGGRATSKSFELVHDAIQTPLVRPGEESLVTSLDAGHLDQRLDTIWAYLEHPLYAPLVKQASRRKPNAIIVWWNAAKTHGVYESTSGAGQTYVGQHYHRKLIDEFQLTTEDGWRRLHDATSDRGCVIRTTGVSDGRVDTPAHRVRNDRAKSMLRTIIPQWITEYWTPGRKRAAKKQYSGEQSHDYRTNVDAEEGDPFHGVWDILDILACTRVLPTDIRKPMEDKRYIHCPVILVAGMEWASVSETEFPLAEIPQFPVWLSADIGYDPDPTIINVWGIETDKRGYFPHEWGKFELRRVDYNHQALFFARLQGFYNAMRIGIDYTGTDGRAVAQAWNQLPLEKRGGAELVLWNASGYVETPVVDEKTNKPQMVKMDVKHFITTKLHTRYRARRAEKLHDEEAIFEYQNEVRQATSGRFAGKDWIYKSRKGDHRIDADRIGEYMIYKASDESKPQPRRRKIFGSRAIGLGRV